MENLTISQFFQKMFESKTISPNYKIPHIIHTLILIGTEPFGIGRYKIKEEVDLGEGSIKTMLSRFKEEGIIQIQTHKQQGHVLTQKGKDLLAKIKKYMSLPRVLENKNNRYVVGKVAFFNIVYHNHLKPHVNLGIPQRDEAIKIGAKGASSLVYKNDRLVFPDSDDSCPIFPELPKKEINENDIIVIGGGSTNGNAILAVIAAAISLVDFK